MRSQPDRAGLEQTLGPAAGTEEDPAKRLATIKKIYDTLNEERFGKKSVVEMTADRLYLPTESDLIFETYRAIGLSDRDIVVDLGMGDGRWLTIARSLFGAKSRGREISPHLHQLAIEGAGRLLQAGLLPPGTLERDILLDQGDLFQENLADATVIVHAKGSALSILPRVEEKILREARPGTRAILSGAEPDTENFTRLKPLQVIQKKGYTQIYQVPAAGMEEAEETPLLEYDSRLMWVNLSRSIAYWIERIAGDRNRLGLSETGEILLRLIGPSGQAELKFSLYERVPSSWPGQIEPTLSELGVARKAGGGLGRWRLQLKLFRAVADRIELLARLDPPTEPTPPTRADRIHDKVERQIIRSAAFDENRLLPMPVEIAAHGHLLAPLKRNFAGLPDVIWREVPVELEAASEVLMDFTAEISIPRIAVLDDMLAAEDEIPRIFPDGHAPVFLVSAETAQLLMPAAVAFILRLQLEPNRLYLLYLEKDDFDQTLITIYA